jgi:hypothetical protein
MKRLGNKPALKVDPIVLGDSNLNANTVEGNSLHDKGNLG